MPEQELTNGQAEEHKYFTYGDQIPPSDPREAKQLLKKRGRKDTTIDQLLNPETPKTNANTKLSFMAIPTPLD